MMCSFPSLLDRLASTALAASVLLAFLSDAGRAADSGFFGNPADPSAGLIGILYDFKQDQKRQSTGIKPDQFPRILGEFLAKDWSESVLNRYFRATRPLYATQIFMPQMRADLAPRAFDLESVIRPSCWIVYYKGQVAAPEDGAYRFLAYADDVIIVGVNQRIVCLAGRPDTAGRFKMWPLPPQGARVPAANGELVYGDWMELKKGEPIDLDIIVGERPGGKFAAFLLYEKRGRQYPTDSEGHPRFPVFQLAPSALPAVPGQEAPPHSLAERTWVGIP
jgi:hypothetical protein